MGRATPGSLPRLKTKLNYRFDAFLLHLVQEATKRPSAEILNFFNELGKQVCDIGSEKRTGRGIRKNIVNYFPGTSIPFHMLVKGYKSRHYDSAAKTYTDDEYMSCSIEVGFPESKIHVNTQILDNIAVELMEQALLGGEPVAMSDFPRPEIKTPKMYKALMEAFTGKKEQE